MADPIIRKRKLSDYRPDPHNANQGTERGQYMIDRSVEEVGAARSIVAAADDTIPIGNHTLQALMDAGLDDVIEVVTDGRTPVVVKRQDWENADHPTARKAAYFDNRTSEVGLSWDAAQIAADMRDAVDLSDLWHDDELTALVEQAVKAAEVEEYAMLKDIGDAGTPPASRALEPLFPLAIVLTVQELRSWNEEKAALGVKDDRAALLALVERMSDDA